MVTRSDRGAARQHCAPVSSAWRLACGAHHLARKLSRPLGHDRAELMPAKYVRPYAKGQKNDFNDAEAIAKRCAATDMKFVAAKTADQARLRSALHRVRERLVSQRTGTSVGSVPSDGTRHRDAPRLAPPSTEIPFITASRQTYCRRACCTSSKTSRRLAAPRRALRPSRVRSEKRCPTGSGLRTPGDRVGDRPII